MESLFKCEFCPKVVKEACELLQCEYCAKKFCTKCTITCQILFKDSCTKLPVYVMDYCTPICRRDDGLMMIRADGTVVV